ncbi:hypothetical protein Hanom_Chr16g01490941 [Helianthus anomalus]
MSTSVSIGEQKDFIFGTDKVPMKQSKDPFEVAFEEIDDSPPDTPYTHDGTEAQTMAAQPTINSQRCDVENNINPLNQPRTRVKMGSTSAANKNKEDDEEEEEEENMDVELGKFSSTGDPDKMAKMQ